MGGSSWFGISPEYNEKIITIDNGAIDASYEFNRKWESLSSEDKKGRNYDGEKKAAIEHHLREVKEAAEKAYDPVKQEVCKAIYEEAEAWKDRATYER